MKLLSDTIKIILLAGVFNIRAIFSIVIRAYNGERSLGFNSQLHVYCYVRLSTDQIWARPSRPQSRSKRMVGPKYKSRGPTWTLDQDWGCSMTFTIGQVCLYYYCYKIFSCTIFTIWQLCIYNFYNMTSFLFLIEWNIPNSLFVKGSIWNNFISNRSIELALLQTDEACQTGSRFFISCCFGVLILREAFVLLV